MEDWVSYYNQEQYGFSESFKKELSKQLGERFIKNLDYENLFEKYFYNLFLGMEEIEIRKKDNYVFGNAEIISPDSRTRSLTICWKSDFFEEKLEIHKQDVEGKIEFFFCSDFPTEELKKYIKYKKSKKYTSSNDPFELDLNFNNFPDLSIKFEVKEKFTLEEENEIGNIFKRNVNIYVSDFKENLILLDFQIDSQNNSGEVLEKAKEFINESLNLIKSFAFSHKISNAIIS